MPVHRDPSNARRSTNRSSPATTSARSISGASQFGIGVACARIAEAILRDERVVLPVAAYRERHGVTIALPTVVGRARAAGNLEPSMSADERHAFEASVATLRGAARGIGVLSGQVGAG